MNILRIALFLCSVSVTQSFAQTIENSSDSTSVDLNEVLVIGKDIVQTPEMGVVSIGNDYIQNTPAIFGEADVLKALQPLPGVTGGIEGFSGLYVRGGENDENLYMVGNLPVYNANHLAGVFSSFNVALVDKVDFYKSTYPSEFGGKVSSLVNMQLKESDYSSYHGQFSLGLLSGNLYCTGPLVKDKLAFSVGLRRSWIDLVTTPLLYVMNKTSDGTDKIAGYHFSDMNVKMDFKHKNLLKGYIQLFWSRDKMALGEEFENKEEGYYKYKSLNDMSVRNLGLSSSLSYFLSEYQYLKSNLYYINYFADYSKKTDDISISDDVEEHKHLYEFNENGLFDIGYNLLYCNNAYGNYTLKAGGGYVYHSYSPDKVRTETNDGSFTSGDASMLNRSHANELFLFADNQFAVSDRFNMNIGMRGVLYNSGKNTHHLLEPRLNACYILSSSLSIKCSYSRVHQYSQQLCNSYIGLPTDAWMPIGDTWKPLSSDNVSFGIFKNFGSNVCVSMEGYRRWLNHLIMYKEGINSFTGKANIKEQIASGSGDCYGLDLLIQKTSGRLKGYCGYGLMWNNRQFPEINGGSTFPSKFDNRHKINVYAEYKIRDNMTLNASWMYMSGNMATVSLYNYKSVADSGFSFDIAPTGYTHPWGLDLYEGKNNLRLPDQHRLDLSLSIHKKIGRNAERILNFGLYNAYCHLNAVQISKYGMLEGYSNNGSKWDTHFQTLSLLPILPSFSYTYKF